MIFVVEAPPQGEPHAWFAFDEDDLLSKIAVDDALQAWEIWDCRTPRELLALFDVSPETPDVEQRYPGICAMAEEHGWDTELYRADHMASDESQRGLYRAEPIGVTQACLAALKQRAGDMRLYRDEEQALHAVDAPDPLYDRPGGWRARWSLRQQLIAVEALADDH